MLGRAVGTIRYYVQVYIHVEYCEIHKIILVKNYLNLFLSDNKLILIILHFYKRIKLVINTKTSCGYSRMLKTCFCLY